jgi:thymidylate synthase (FAD)
MVARQWWKHAVASSHLDDQTGWNETSRRYVTENETFYIPDINEWRAAALDKKQGSSGLAHAAIGAKYTQAMRRIIRMSMDLYEEALNDGIAPEQARLLLPANALYVRWRWTASLNALLNFLDLRLGHGAQSEIKEYAEAVESVVEQLWPESYAAWGEQR